MSEQRTAAWFSIRTGKLTASNMAAATLFLKNGNPSQERIKLMHNIIAERLTDSVAPHFVNDAMRWGIETEDDARDAYFKKTGVWPKPCFFFEHFDIENFGASPDGLVDPDGLVEFKCPTTATHVKWSLDGVVPEEHKPQMLAQLACTRRVWCDFVSFDPRVKGPSQLFIKRFEPTAEEISAVEDAARKFLAEVDAMFDIMTETV